MMENKKEKVIKENLECGVFIYDEGAFEDE